MRKFLHNLLLTKPSLNPFIQFRCGLLRRLTSFLRKDPDFMLIGAGKAGTTSLEYYLTQHPKIESTTVKEIHYFDYGFKNGKGWYKSHFPTIFNKNISGDCTPNYLDHPVAVERIKTQFPKMKFIVILRDPIERAYSQYQHTKRNGDESLTFEDAIKQESQRLQGEIDKIKNDPLYPGTNYNKYSYLERSKYYPQLKKWFEFFDKTQFLILQYETAFIDPKKTMNIIFRFLNLDSFENIKFNIQNTGGNYEKLDSETQNKLKKLFHPFNLKLKKLVNIDYN